MNIASVGLPILHKRIKRDLPKQLFLANGRFTLTLEYLHLSFGIPLYVNQIIELCEGYPCPDARNDSLNIELIFDIVDEDAYEIGGTKYKEAESRFELERKHS